MRHRFAAAFDDGHLLAVAAVAGDGGIDGALARGECAPDKGGVSALHVARFELFGEMLVRRIVLGDGEQAGGFLIDAVDDAGTGDAADAG